MTIIKPEDVVNSKQKAAYFRPLYFHSAISALWYFRLRWEEIMNNEIREVWANLDHSLVGEMVMIGLLSSAHPYFHINQHQVDLEEGPCSAYSSSCHFCPKIPRGKAVVSQFWSLTQASLPPPAKSRISSLVPGHGSGGWSRCPGVGLPRFSESPPNTADSSLL